MVEPSAAAIAAYPIFGGGVTDPRDYPLIEAQRAAFDAGVKVGGARVQADALDEAAENLRSVNLELARELWRVAADLREVHSG